MVEITATEQNIEKRIKRNEDSLRDSLDNIKCTNNHIIGVLEGEERENGLEKIFEGIVAEHFPNMGKEIVNQVQKAQSPRQDKPKEEYTGTEAQVNDLEDRMVEITAAEQNTEKRMKRNEGA